MGQFVEPSRDAVGGDPRASGGSAENPLSFRSGMDEEKRAGAAEDNAEGDGEWKQVESLRSATLEARSSCLAMSRRVCVLTLERGECL